VVAGAVALGSLLPERSGGTDFVGEAPWLIVAEMEGSASEEIRGAVHDLITSALEQSPAVRTLPEENTERGLVNMGRPDTTRLTEEVALELALRGQIHAVVSGEVNQIGSTYALSFRIVTPDSGAVVATQAGAATDDAVISAVSEAATDLVQSLSDNPAALGPLIPLYEVITPSMAALQAFREYDTDHFIRGDMGPLERAVTIDPAFAQAWASLGVGAANRGLLDSARVAFETAIRYPERLAPMERALVEAELAALAGDMVGAHEHLREGWLAGGAGHRGAVNLSVVLAFLGRFASADSVLQLTHVPFGRQVAAAGNELSVHIALGQPESARTVLDEIADAFPDILARSELEFYVGHAEWSDAERVAVGLTSDPTVSPRDRHAALIAGASALAARGEAGAAAGRLREGAEFFAAAPGGLGFPQLLRRLGVVQGTMRTDLPVDTASATGLVEAALDAALADDRVQAERHLGDLSSLPSDQLLPLGSAPDVVTAVLAASTEDWGTAIGILEPMEAWTWPHFRNAGPNLGGVVLWTLAQAFEATGDLDSAVTFYEKLASPMEMARRYDFYGAGLTYSFAHQRLVILYSELGRVEDARRVWAVFQATFSNPDPELVHLVEEARAAVDGLTG
jgi:tetratricopeptide (TPR) repeat protein